MGDRDNDVVIPCKILIEGSNSENKSRMGLVFGWVGLFTGIVALKGSYPKNDTPAISLITSLSKSVRTTLLLSLVIIALQFHFASRRRPKRELKIMVSFLGLQIEWPSSAPIFFVPMDEVIDCVVVERILAHRVSSQVVLRILPNRMEHPSSSPKIIPLLGTESYQDCLHIRRKIQQAIISAKKREKLTTSGS